MKKATVRLYQRGQDIEERFRCPYCGHKQQADPDQMDAGYGVCVWCGGEVKLQYRVVRGKNY